MARDWITLLKETIRIALPVVISQVGMVMIGIVDTLVVGQVSSLELAGVGAGVNLFMPVTIIGIGLLLGLDTVVSQNYGARRIKRCHELLTQGIYLAAWLSIIFTIVIVLFARYYDRLGVDPEIAKVTQPYLEIVSWSTPAVLLFAAIQRFWYGMQVVLPFIAILLVANIANYFADLAFVTGRWGFPALGAEGVAYSTMVTRYGMLLMGIALTLYRLRGQWAKVFRKPFDWLTQKEVLRIGIPAGAQFGLEVGVFGIITQLAAYLGKLPLAAHHIALSVVGFTFMVPLGLSSAAAVQVGAHIGGKRPQVARRAGWLILGLAALFMSGTALTFYLIPETIFGWFTEDREVIEMGLKILVFAMIFQVADGVQIVGTGALRGLGNTRSPFFANLIGHYPIGMAVGITLCFHLGQGVVGLWTGLMVGLSSVAIWLTVAWHHQSKKSQAANRVI